MSLIKSISGIRGTIGGKAGENLTPLDAVQFASAYGKWAKEKYPHKRIKLVIGRDARISGPMIQNIVQNTLVGMGIDVIDLGLSTTPSVEMAVTGLNADGGIILTASHNPKQWNALKLLNEKGEFLSAQDGKKLMDIIESGEIEFAPVDELGKITQHQGGYIKEHIKKILALPVVSTDLIKQKKIKVAVDAVNSTGGLAIPALLEALGVEYKCLYCSPTGDFPHNPEPLEENLGDIMQTIRDGKFDLGIVVDPDVDRLALIDENGHMFGEEYTLVAVADYILSKTKGNTVSNLSSSRALKDISDKYKVEYHKAKTGEVNVVEKMKEVDAVIGGEGNGGVIYPALHSGRDALLGIALILSYLSESGKTLSQLKEQYPLYFMSKNKMQVSQDFDLEKIMDYFIKKNPHAEIDTQDGIRIDFEDSWVQIRKSNTEPIIRIYSEALTPEKAHDLAMKTIQEIKKITP
jgi:phosphomannomutase